MTDSCANKKEQFKASVQSDEKEDFYAFAVDERSERREKLSNRRELQSCA